jgi:hypothetical protein
MAALRSAALALAISGVPLLCADAPALPAEIQKLIDDEARQEAQLHQEFDARIKVLYQDLIHGLAKSQELALRRRDADGAQAIKAQIANLQLASPAESGGPAPLRPSGSALISIACGGAAVGPFAADQCFSGGREGLIHGVPVSTTGVLNAAPAAVYENERVGPDMVYTIPGLKPGSPYVVRLHFAEIYWTMPGERVFGILINGSAVQNAFDIVVAAHGPKIAVVRDFPATATATGTIVISFNTVYNIPKLSGLEILRSAK